MMMKNLTTVEPVRKREIGKKKFNVERKRLSYLSTKIIQSATLYGKTKGSKSNFLIRIYLRNSKLSNSFGEEDKKSSNEIN